MLLGLYPRVSRLDHPLLSDHGSISPCPFLSQCQFAQLAAFQDAVWLLLVALTQVFDP